MTDSGCQIKNKTLSKFSVPFHRFGTMWTELDIDYKRKDKGVTAAFLAASRGHICVLKYLYANGANLFIKCHLGKDKAY